MAGSTFRPIRRISGSHCAACWGCQPWATTIATTVSASVRSAPAKSCRPSARPCWHAAPWSGKPSLAARCRAQPPDRSAQCSAIRRFWPRTRCIATSTRRWARSRASRTRSSLAPRPAPPLCLADVGPAHANRARLIWLRASGDRSPGAARNDQHASTCPGVSMNTTQTRWRFRPDHSNWGDYGPDDRLGQLNEITRNEDGAPWRKRRMASPSACRCHWTRVHGSMRAGIRRVSPRRSATVVRATTSAPATCMPV